MIPILKIKLGSEEIEAVTEVLKSGRLRQGEKVKEFEEAFSQKVGAKYAIAVSSGTAALHIAYLSVLNSGEEVIFPSFTFIATASMVYYSNCKPIFCDINPNTFTIDIEDIKKKLTDKTSAIVPVHLFGNACDMDEIIKLAKENNLKIIWDAAQAHGTKYKNRDIGGFDDLVCYSFYPSKNMTTGEGGMITTNNPALYEKCRLIRSHGQKRKYYHTILGFNYRMTDIEASIGLEQLKKLDHFVNKRRENAKYLTKHLSQIDGIITPLEKEEVKHSFNQYSILLDLNYFRCTRDEFVNSLKEKGIEAAVHYPRSLHKQPIFREIAGDLVLPISENISKRILSLPVYPSLEKKDLDKIIEALKEVVTKYRI